MPHYALGELAKIMTQTKEDRTLQMVNGDYLGLQYFAKEIDWHTENRDEFFLVLDGAVEFSIENRNC